MLSHVYAVTRMAQRVLALLVATHYAILCDGVVTRKANNGYAMHVTTYDSGWCDTVLQHRSLALSWKVPTIVCFSTFTSFHHSTLTWPDFLSTFCQVLQARVQQPGPQN